MSTEEPEPVEEDADPDNGSDEEGLPEQDVEGE
jgi:hypothetical protein